MSKTIRVALGGAGAFGIKHLDAIKQIDGVEVVSLMSREAAEHIGSAEVVRASARRRRPARRCSPSVHASAA